MLLLHYCQNSAIDHEMQPLIAQRDSFHVLDQGPGAGWGLVGIKIVTALGPRRQFRCSRV